MSYSSDINFGKVNNGIYNFYYHNVYKIYNFIYFYKRFVYKK